VAAWLAALLLRRLVLLLVVLLLLLSGSCSCSCPFCGCCCSQVLDQLGHVSHGLPVPHRHQLIPHLVTAAPAGTQQHMTHSTVKQEVRDCRNECHRQNKAVPCLQDMSEAAFHCQER
jgi:hypothetical protein